ncbi:MAG: isopropylmalate isomerase [Alphaproteobacteria bacterium HGW-Alphaproteobacteria-14]|nr:MAG: isopropylmalate isomerase [Alphaproteobacteria bacterium HGW-Alphaproteobacteria-14]
MGAAAIGSAAVAAALLYAGRKFAAKKKPNEPAQPGTIPSGEPPETD